MQEYFAVTSSPYLFRRILVPCRIKRIHVRSMQVRSCIVKQNILLCTLFSTGPLSLSTPRGIDGGNQLGYRKNQRTATALTFGRGRQ